MYSLIKETIKHIWLTIPSCVISSESKASLSPNYGNTRVVQNIFWVTLSHATIISNIFCLIRKFKANFQRYKTTIIAIVRWWRKVSPTSYCPNIVSIAACSERHRTESDNLSVSPKQYCCDYGFYTEIQFWQGTFGSDRGTFW